MRTLRRAFTGVVAYGHGMRSAGIVAVLLLAIIAAFQIALAAGAPLGRAAWGGQHPGVLPRRLRMTSGVVGLVVYPLIIAVVLSAAGLTRNWLGGAAAAVLWGLTAFFAIGTVMNAVSRSRPERVWAVVSVGLAIACGVIASQR